MVNWQVHIGFGRVQPDKYETGPFTGLRSGLILITLIWVAIWYLTKKNFTSHNTQKKSSKTNGFTDKIELKDFYLDTKYDYTYN